MASMSLELSDELKKIMEKHKEVQWGSVARQAMWIEASKLELVDKMLSKSNFTEKDAESVGHKIKYGIAKKHGLVK